VAAPSPATAAAQAAQAARVLKTSLPNGLTVIARRDASAPAVAIVTFVKAGYFDEADDVVGISHVLEHMYFKGTFSRGVGEIARETKAAGGDLNAHTIYDHTSYYTVLPAASFREGLAIQADAYANSAIDAEELRRELAVIVQEAQRKEDSPGAVSTETLYALMFDRHRMRRWRIGRPDQLRTFTREQVVAFYRNFYQPENTILSVVGDIDAEEAVRAIELAYGPLPSVPVWRASGPSEDPGRRASGRRYREWAGDITQTQVLLGWHTPATLHTDTPLLELVAAILATGRASRLYRAVREQKLASAVSAYNYAPTELGVFVIHAESPPERAANAARAIWTELLDLCERGVTAHELDRAQRVIEARWLRRQESMDGQASHLSEWEALGGWELGDEYLARLLGATATEVAEAARRYLVPDNAALAVYRPTHAPEVGPDVLSGDSTRHPSPAGTRVDAFEREEAGVRVYRTAAGVPILIRRKPGLALMYLGVYALGGSRDETADHAGLTTLVARGAVKGTEHRTAAQLSDEGEMLGGSISASVGGENFGWSISVPGRHTTAAIDLLSDVVLRATFPDEAIETERAIVLAEIAALRDDMYRYPMRLATEAAYVDHPYGRSTNGTESSVRALTAHDIRQWHRARVCEAPTVIAAVSDLEPDGLAATLASAFRDLRSGDPDPLAPPVWPSSPALRAETRDKAQTALAMAFPAPARTDPDRVVARLIAGIASGLGGRLFEELRDRQSLAYTVHAAATARTLGGMFITYMATSPGAEDRARAGLIAELTRLCDDLVGAEELARAQSYAIGSRAISLQSGATVLGQIIEAWLLGTGLSELAEHDARVRAVSADDIRRVARQSFDPARVAEGVVRGRVAC